MEFVNKDSSFLIDGDIKSRAIQDSTKAERFETLEFFGDEFYRQPILYRKWESQSKILCDTYHPPDKPWVEQTTDVPSVIAGLSPRMFYKADDGNIRPVQLDDGCIFEWCGVYNRKVAIISGGQILSEEEAEARQEMSGKEFPRYNEWVFRLKKIIFTDGPLLAQRHSEAVEQKRQRAEKEMFDKQNQFFDVLMTRMGVGQANPTNIDQSPQSPMDLVKMAMALPEGERRNMLEYIASELEESVDAEEVATVPEFVAESVSAEPEKVRRTRKKE